MVGDGHTTVIHGQLLHLEVADVKGSGERSGGKEGVDLPESSRRVQGNGYLYLLCQCVCGERNRETVVGGEAPDGDGDVGELVNVVICKSCNRVTTERQNGVGLLTGTDLTKILCEYLLSGHKILRTSRFSPYAFT